MVVRFLFLFLISIIERSLGNSNLNHGNSPNNIGGVEGWRNIESYFNRLNSRLDQLVLRFDHLDSRINRFTSLLQGRLDGVENSLSTTKLKMDLWGEELNRIDEQLTRKWKNMESKYELMVPSIDSKLENKAVIIQRDNRRHNEHLSSIILGMGQRFDAKVENILNIMKEEESKKNATSNTCLPNPVIKIQPTPGIQSVSGFNESKLIDIVQIFNNKSDEILKSNTAVMLVGTKVTNMFEDLIKRSDSLHTHVKESITISNNTRQELHESFRTLSQSRLRQSLSFGSSMTSSETMSAVIVEALASVESMSTVIGRRMAELSRSIEGRFEIVSTTLNEFFDSCTRIQDRAPLIEEHIASILEKMLDGIENTTMGSQFEILEISRKLDLILNRTTIVNNQQTCSSSSQVNNEIDESEVISTTISPSSYYEDPNKYKTAEILENSKDLTEDEKKLLWDSLFPNQNQHEVPD